MCVLRNGRSQFDKVAGLEIRTRTQYLEGPPQVAHNPYGYICTTYELLSINIWIPPAPRLIHHLSKTLTKSNSRVLKSRDALPLPAWKGHQCEGIPSCLPLHSVCLTVHIFVVAS